MFLKTVKSGTLENYIKTMFTEVKLGTKYPEAELCSRSWRNLAVRLEI